MKLDNQREVLFQLGEEKKEKWKLLNEKGKQHQSSKGKGNPWHTKVYSAIKYQVNSQPLTKLEREFARREEKFEEKLEGRKNQTRGNQMIQETTTQRLSRRRGWRNI